MLSQYEFPSPGPVNVTITVSNTSDAGMPPCAPDDTSVVHAAQYDGSVCLIFNGDAHILTATVGGNRLLPPSFTDAPGQAVLPVPILSE